MLFSPPSSIQWTISKLTSVSVRHVYRIFFRCSLLFLLFHLQNNTAKCVSAKYSHWYWCLDYSSRVMSKVELEWKWMAKDIELDVLCGWSAYIGFLQRICLQHTFDLPSHMERIVRFIYTFEWMNLMLSLAETTVSPGTLREQVKKSFAYMEKLA